MIVVRSSVPPNGLGFGAVELNDERNVTSIVSSLASCPPAELRERLCGRLAEFPRCGVARYLLACQELERNRPATAVRHLMVAHRALPALDSAALLVFAGLNWIHRRSSPLLPVLLTTWEEFRRPEFDRTPKERELLDAFAQPLDGIEQVSALARRLWRLPIGSLRTQIREAVAERAMGPYALLLSPA